MMRQIRGFDPVLSAKGPTLAGAMVFLLLLTLLVVPGAGQGGARVLQRNLAELVGDSSTIVAGRVLSVESEPHPQFANIPTVVVRLQVSEVWKGEAETEFTFRQFVVDYRGPQSTLGYKAGQEVLLFLTRPSEYGLSSPAGLDQGRFRVTQDARGNRVATNDVNNWGLLRNIDKQAPKLASQVSLLARQLLTEHRRGPIAYDQLRELVRTIISAQ